MLFRSGPVVGETPGSAGLSDPEVPLDDSPTVAPVSRSAGNPGTDRSALVYDFLQRCNQEPDLPEKIRKTHIWRSVEHGTGRQFQYWQKRDPAATGEDERNFGRTLAMEPGEFVALLRKKNLLSNKS